MITSRRITVKELKVGMLVIWCGGQTVVTKIEETSRGRRKYRGGDGYDRDLRCSDKVWISERTES